MKHRQNHGRIRLPEEAFEALQANTMETINLEIDKELLNEIRTLSTADKEIQEIRRKKASGTTHDGKIALRLCKENSVLLRYDGLIWVPDNDTLRLRILRDHHNAQATGHPGRARTLELVSRISTGQGNESTSTDTSTTVTPAIVSSQSDTCHLDC